MAIANPHITATVVEATEFPDLVRRYQVTGVPKIVINDRVELLGAQPEDVFVSAVVAAQASSAARGDSMPDPLIP